MQSNSSFGVPQDDILGKYYLRVVVILRHEGTIALTAILFTYGKANVCPPFYACPAYVRLNFSFPLSNSLSLRKPRSFNFAN